MYNAPNLNIADMDFTPPGGGGSSASGISVPTWVWVLLAAAALAILGWGIWQLTRKVEVVAQSADDAHKRIDDQNGGFRFLNP